MNNINCKYSRSIKSVCEMYRWFPYKKKSPKKSKFSFQAGFTRNIPLNKDKRRDRDKRLQRWEKEMALLKFRHVTNRESFDAGICLIV